MLQSNAAKRNVKAMGLERPVRQDFKAKFNFSKNVPGRMCFKTWPK